MAVWEQLQELSDSQFVGLCQKYNVTPLFPTHKNRYWLARRLHVAIVSEQAKWRARQEVYGIRRNDRSAGYPARGYRKRRQRNAPTYVQRYKGGDELHFDRGQSEEEEDELEFKVPMRGRVEDEEEEKEHSFRYDYEQHQAQQAQHAQQAQQAEQQQQEMMLQDRQRQQEQQQQEQKEQMRLLQLQQHHQQRQLQHLEQHLQQLEEKRLRMSDFQRADQEVPATWTYQQQLEQMQQNQGRPPQLPHAEPQGFPQELAQRFPHDLQPELELQEDLSTTELLPQRTMMDLALTSDFVQDPEEETDYLTASSGLEIQLESEVRTVNYLTSAQLEKIMNEKQRLLDNSDCHLAKLYSRTDLFNEFDSIGDAPGAADVPYYRTRHRHRGFWRQVLHVFRFRPVNKLRVHNLRYTILCCALAVCTFMGAKLLK